MTTVHTNYHAWIIRAWPENPESDTSTEWRFRVENLRTGKQFGFSSFQELIHYLQTECQQEVTAKNGKQ